MINKPPPFQGLNCRIPILIPIKGRGFLNQGSRLSTSSMDTVSGSVEDVVLKMLEGDP